MLKIIVAAITGIVLGTIFAVGVLSAAWWIIVSEQWWLMVLLVFSVIGFLVTVNWWVDKKDRP